MLEKNNASWRARTIKSLSFKPITNCAVRQWLSIFAHYYMNYLLLCHELVFRIASHLFYMYMAHCLEGHPLWASLYFIHIKIMGWNGLWWDKREWSDMDWDWPSLAELGWTKIGWADIGLDDSDWTGMGWAGLRWPGMRWDRMVWHGLRLAGLRWARLR